MVMSSHPPTTPSPPTPPPPPSRLLVSVRNAGEAAIVQRTATARGLKIVVDLKDPSTGPLAPASLEVVKDVADRWGDRVTLSAAAGELVDSPDPTAWRNLRLTYVKLALAHAPANWPEKLAEFAHALPPVKFIVAAYADHLRAESPDPALLADWVLSHRELAAGLLIDTAIKDGLGLFHWMPPDRLKDIRRRLRSTGQRLALAGSLKWEDMPNVLAIGPDLVAVRGAACAQGNRQAGIDEAAVDRLCRIIESSGMSSATGEG